VHEHEKHGDSRDLLIVFAAALSFRLVLLILFPVPYGNDAAGRLYFRDTLWIGHWLPVTQALVNATFAVTQSVGMVRLIFAIMTSLSTAAFALYMQTFASRRTAFFGGILFATNSLLVFLSLMPYQEVVFLGLLFGSLAFFNRFLFSAATKSDFLAGSLLYGLACLTRYEAWFILPVLLFAMIRRALPSGDALSIVRTTAKTFAGLLWGPTLWMLINWFKWGSPAAFLFHRADHTFYAWAPHSEAERIVNYLGMMLYWLGRFGSPLMLLAIPGIWVVWKNQKSLLPVLTPVIILLIMVMAFLTFIAGREFATANRFASFPLAIMLIFVALGVEEIFNIIKRSRKPWAVALNKTSTNSLVLGVIFLLLLFYGAVPVAQAHRHPEFRGPYEVAQFLESHISVDESAIIIGESIDGAVPMPYQRVFGQLTFDRQRLMCSALLDPAKVRDAASFVREKRVRHAAVFGAGWEPHGSDEIFLDFLKNSTTQHKIAFANQSAIVYDLLR